MARARNIKPGFFRNADLVELSYEARLMFIGLWTIADRAGRLEDRPKQIKMELFPADNVDCDAILDQLQTIGMVDRYEFGGKSYLQVVNFCKHQNPHKDEKHSVIPDRNGTLAAIVKAEKKQCNKGANSDLHRANTVQAPCEHDANTVAIGLIPDSLIPESKPIAQPDGFAEFWRAWPKRVGKAKAMTAWKKHKPSLPAVLAAIDAWMGSEKWTKDGGKYIPDPATWLNSAGWEDELAVSVRASSSGSIGGLPRHMMLRDEVSA